MTKQLIVLLCLHFCSSCCFGSPIERQWRPEITNELQWVEIRPFMYDSIGDADTFSKVVVITNATVVAELAAEMFGSSYPVAEVIKDHWICRKWVQIDFHTKTNTIGFIVGTHSRHRVAMAKEICDFGWQGWKAWQDGAKSGLLPEMLEQVCKSFNVKWVSADMKHVGNTHYGVPASAFPPGDSRSGIGDVDNPTPDPNPNWFKKLFEGVSVVGLETNR